MNGSLNVFLNTVFNYVIEKFYAFINQYTLLINIINILFSLFILLDLYDFGIRIPLASWKDCGSVLSFMFYKII